MNPSYMAGRNAANLGLDVWANPHSDKNARKDDFLYWFSGWCYQKRLLSGATDLGHQATLDLREIISTMRERKCDTHISTINVSGNLVTVEVKLCEVLE